MKVPDGTSQHATHIHIRSQRTMLIYLVTTFFYPGMRMSSHALKSPPQALDRLDDSMPKLCSRLLTQVHERSMGQR